MELIIPGIGLIFWLSIIFFILLFLLKKFAWKPILSMLKEREESIENALQSADKAREEMSLLSAENESLLKKAHQEREVLLKEARVIRDNIIEDSRITARNEAERILEAAKENIQRERKEAVYALKGQLGDMAVDIAEKLLAEELSKDNRQKEYLKKLIDEVNFN